MLTISGVYLYYALSFFMVGYLFRTSWRLLVRKEKHLTLWQKSQLWLVEKANGQNAARQKRLKWTTEKYNQFMGREYLLSGILILFIVLLDIVIYQEVMQHA